MRLRSRRRLDNALVTLDISERELARRALLGHATVNHLVTGRRLTCQFTTAASIENALRLRPGELFEPLTEEERRLVHAAQRRALRRAAEGRR